MHTHIQSESLYVCAYHIYDFATGVKETKNTFNFIT